MTLALLLASSDPPDDVGAPGRYAESAASRRMHEAAAATAERDRAWAEGLRSTNEPEARRALSYIIEGYADRLTRFAYGFVESVDAAEDVVQDVFVRVWERRENIKPEESLRAYLFTAVRRASLDQLKRHGVEARYAASLTQGPPDHATLTVDDRLDAESVARAIRSAIARLTERRRTALRLRYEEQLPFATVAEVMGLSEKAAKHLVARAVEEVRGYLGL